MNISLKIENFKLNIKNKITSIVFNLLYLISNSSKLTLFTITISCPKLRNSLAFIHFWKLFKL